MAYQGETTTLYSSFVTLEGKEPTTIVDPKVTIRHIDSVNVLVTDVDEATMTLLAENTYYYKWVISSSADLGNYTIEYQAIIDGEYAESNVTIKVEEP